MKATFLVTLDAEVIDPVGLQTIAEDLHSILDPHFEVIEVKPWDRQSLPQTTTGVPPITGI